MKKSRNKQKKRRQITKYSLLYTLEPKIQTLEGPSIDSFISEFNKFVRLV